MIFFGVFTQMQHIFYVSKKHSPLANTPHFHEWTSFFSAVFLLISKRANKTQTCNWHKFRKKDFLFSLAPKRLVYTRHQWIRLCFPLSLCKRFLLDFERLRAGVYLMAQKNSSLRTNLNLFSGVCVGCVYSIKLWKHLTMHQEQCTIPGFF
jgi:hypothetical protein